MAITVKKKLTLKAEPEPEASVTAATTGPDLMAAPGMVKGKSPSYTVYAILGLIAVLLFAVLVLLQGLEWSYYNQPPSAFPVLTPEAAPAPVPDAVPDATPDAAPDES